MDAARHARFLLGLVFGLHVTAAVAEPAAEGDSYPLEVAREWTYELQKQRVWFEHADVPNGWVREEVLTGTAVRRVAGTSPRFPAYRPVYRVVEELEEKDPRMGTTRSLRAVQLIARDGPRVLLLAHKTSRPGELPPAWRIAREPPVLFDPAATGGEMTSGILPPLEGTSVRSRLLDQGLVPDPVEVPAGRFEGCLRTVVETTFRDRSDLPSMWQVRAVAVSTSWYAPGVGLVRQEQSIEVYKRLYVPPAGPYDLPGERDWIELARTSEELVSSETVTRVLVSYEEP